MIAPIFIRSETLSLKRNSKTTASVNIFSGKNVACNYCIIPEKNVACNSEEKNGECNFEGEKTTSVTVKKTASVYSHGPSRPS
jgi:tRNA A37 methylthiotransferase MiaB